MRRSFLVSTLALLLACGSQRSTEKTHSGTPSPSASASSVASAKPIVSDLPEVPRDTREAILASAANALLGHEHVRARTLDDSVSKEAFQRFIEELDGGKLLLLDGDVQKLALFEKDMDDEVRSGDLALGRKGAALLTSRRKVVADIVARLLATPLDFTANETIETDPKKLAFCKTEDELTTRWRGMLKLQVLERTQQLEDILDRKAHPKPDAKPVDPDDAKRDAAAEKALGEIPATFEGRRDKVQKEIATRYSTQFTRLASVDKLEATGMFINAMNAVFDPHTNYLPPAQEADFDISLTGRLEGIGATLREQDHYIVVNDLVPGGAAWQQGKLEIGDLILAVAQEGKDPVDVTDMPIGKVVSMIRGPKATVVILTVKKADGTIKTISITRDLIRIEASYARGAVLKTKTNGDVGYVHLPGFYGEGGKAKAGERNATDDMRTILTQLTKKGMTSLVFDLRGNGGGLLSHARDISGLFIKDGPVVQTKDGKSAVEVLRDKDLSISFDGPVVVLVDRFCASAAEIVAGALQDYERAVVVGTSATHGKGTVQTIIDLDRQMKNTGDPLGAYKITIQEYFRVSGGSTQLKGVVPDVLLPDPTSYVESGERTLFHAIPWSTIEPVAFTKVPHTWKAADLAAASVARTSANADLATVTKFAKIMEARKDKTVKSLARDAWQAEYKRAKAELEALDPKQKEPKPLMEVAPLTQEAAAQDPRTQKRLDRWKDSLAKDLWVDETVRILADMKKGDAHGTTVIADELTSDAITASFRLVQRRRGHRFSIDDLATAWEAARVVPEAVTYLDLGCGVGSVLLMLAWRMPAARCFGIEAQDMSIELARRNVRDNGLADRVTLHHGDLRDVTRAWPHEPCTLVTGTPPYLPLGTASASPDPQRAAARLELRGGVEDYLAAAARVLSPDGVVVVCSDGRAPARVHRGAAAADLIPTRRLDIIPKAGRSPLFSVWTCARTARAPLEHAEVIMRDENGERTPSSQAMREAFGLTPG